MSNTRNSPIQARTLEYRQAMKDFHVMFPTLGKDVIECVLRANAGHVDSTIDQLLQLTQDSMSQNGRNATFERLYYTYDDSTESSGSLSPELRDRLSSSDDDRPPRYVPSFEPPPPPAFTFSTNPVEAYPEKHGDMSQHSSHRKTYRDWNPPLLGALPPDFLRIVPDRNRSSRTQTSPMHKSRSEGWNSPPITRQSHSHLPDQSNSRMSSSGSRKPLDRRRTVGEASVRRDNDGNSSHSPQRRMVMVESPKTRSSSSHHHRNHQQPLHRHFSSPASRRTYRSGTEEAQYVEDRKVALLLQNEEFLKELRRNEQFLQELNEDSSTSESRAKSSNPRDQFTPISIDPMVEMATARDEPSSQDFSQSVNSSEDKAFKESLKHMSKSAKKSFYEIARRFSARKKYKSMNDHIDPVFANCNDED
ncbi:unnamed protein product [Clavelina lepadiformis]|uniref:CUE domain-containing protein n=1 Tax=Clavelina lepadiformis TaxID=159417 RepID=A0ABP0FW70_CLALP